MLLAWESSPLRAEIGIYQERWYSETEQIKIQRTHCERSEQFVRGATKCFIQRSTRQRRQRGNRGNRCERTEGCEQTVLWRPSSYLAPRWGFYWVGQTLKAVKDAILWVGEEGGQSVSLSRWWFNPGCQIQNPKRKTRPGCNIWVLKADWVQILALLLNSK